MGESLKAIVIIFLLLFKGCSSSNINLNDLTSVGEYQSRKYSLSRHICYKSLVTVLNKVGPEILLKIDNKNYVITKRQKLIAKGVAPIQSTKTKYKKTNSAIIKQNQDGIYINEYQSYQLALLVDGNNKNCQITISKFRVWIGQKEIFETPKEFVIEEIWKPLFKNIEKELNRYL